MMCLFLFCEKCVCVCFAGYSKSLMIFPDLWKNISSSYKEICKYGQVCCSIQLCLVFLGDFQGCYFLRFHQEILESNSLRSAGSFISTTT